jgi:hypothetical protein
MSNNSDAVQEIARKSFEAVGHVAIVYEALSGCELTTPLSDVPEEHRT